MSVIKKHLFISGTVQGVGFRYFTSREASRRNLNGWVKNLPDGRVEVLLSGDEQNVKEMMERLNEGPAAAVVKSMEVLPAEEQTKLEGFEIRRS